MAAPLDLSRAKENLAEALGDRMKQYMENLKLWFKQKQSRDQFDMQARKMLTSDIVHLHNEFLLAILTKCQSLTPTLVPKDMNTSALPVAKVIKKGTKFKRKPVGRSLQRFQPVDPMCFVAKSDVLAPQKDIHLTFCSREKSLPDTSMVYGRMYVTAWETDLEEVEDEAVKLVMEAVEVHLKNVISCAIHQRKGYHLREGRFKYATGDVRQPYLRNSSLIQDGASEATYITSCGAHVPSIKPSVETGQGDAAKHIACSGNHMTPTRPLNLYNLLDALKVHKSVIASHTVYTLCMERILSRLWHPSDNDLTGGRARHQTSLKMKLSS